MLVYFKSAFIFEMMYMLDIIPVVRSKDNLMACIHSRHFSSSDALDLPELIL